MSPEFAAVVENVGKCYHIYDKNIDRLKHALAFGHRKLYREFWALRDISFALKRGDTLGIVGANGSGKSTLLQLLFGVLHPTEGKISITGKVGGLLELAAGFNPEETGRENVLINAAILGVPAVEIPALFEKVAAFADIGDFLDQPLKVYSSGMAVRLGFALQISIPCDVLIIDEALAVGDELFQRRCFAALEKFRNDGGTVMFVSHGAAIVKQLCQQAIFLDHGRLIQQGSAKIVVDSYQKFLYMREPDKSQFREQLMRTQPATVAAPPPPLPAEAPASVEAAAATPAIAAPQRPLGWDQGVDQHPPAAEFDFGLLSQTANPYQSIGAVISNPRLQTLDGRAVNLLNPHERYRFCYRVEFIEEASGVLFGFLVKSTSGLELGGGAHDSAEGYLRQAPAGAIYDVTFEFKASLYPGIYYMNCGVLGEVGGHSGFLHRVIDALAFRVRNVYIKEHTGFVDLDYRTTVHQAEAGPAKNRASDLPTLAGRQ